VRHPFVSRTILRRAGLGVALGALLTGIVDAQPTPPTPPAATEAPAAPVGPPAEQAPPINVPTPAPLVVPPVTDAEVAPARAPKEQVVEKPVEAPILRTRYRVAVIQALDKVTAETLRFEAAVGAPVRWKGLVFTVRACERSAPDEPIEDSVVYLTIDAQPRPQRGRPPPPPRQAFKGWMYASSPGLHPVEHATYDAWAISCRADRPLTPVAAVAPRRSAPAPAPKSKPPTPAPEPKVLVAPPAKAPEPKAAPELSSETPAPSP
jgi:hypothetical protein